jgi:hypothetical protein
MVIFVAAALLASRNVPVASLVMLPGMARACQCLGRLDGSERSVVLVGGVGAVALVGALMVVSSVASSTYTWEEYPVEAISWMEANGLGTGERRVAHQDFVGNYLTAVKGEDARVFFDDRFDMYPEAVADDYDVLLAGTAEWAQVLDDNDIDTVLWERNLPLAALLRVSPEWQVVYEDQTWMVASRR